MTAQGNLNFCYIVLCLLTFSPSMRKYVLFPSSVSTKCYRFLPNSQLVHQLSLLATTSLVQQLYLSVL